MSGPRVIMVALLAAVVGWTSAPASAAPPVTGPASWAQDGFGPGNTAANPGERQITVADAGALRYRWSILSGVARGSCMSQTAPVVAGRRLFLTDQTGFGAYNAATGRALWRRDVPAVGLQETPKLAVVGDTLLAAANDCGSTSDPDGDLTAYDAATGALRWTVARDAPMYQLVVDRDAVVVGGGDAAQDVVGAYRRGNGAALWTRTDVTLGAGVSAGGRVLLTRTDHSGSFTVDIRTGRTLWTTTADWTVLAADPGGNRFYVSDPAGRLTVVRAADGGIVWSVPTMTAQDGATTEIAVTADRVYVPRGEHLLALRAGDGSTVWDRELYAAVGRPVVAGGVLYVQGAGQPLSIMDVRTGDGVEDQPVVAEIRGHAVVVDGRLYVTDGRVLDTFTR